MKKGTIVLLICAFFCFIALSSSIVIVQENQYVLVKQFNKVGRIIDTSGLKMKIPFIQSTDNLPKEILLYDLPSSDVLTKDKKAMVIDSYVLWKISDPLKFVQTLSTVAEAERRIDSSIYNAMKNSIGQLNQDEVIAGRDSVLNKEILELIGPSLNEYGIEIIENEFKRLDLPKDNKNAVYTRMISERSQIAAGYSAEGKEEAQKIINTTDREVSIIISTANAKAAETLAQGESEYMRILAGAYAGAERSEFYEYMRSLDAIKISLTGDNKTLFLPIDSPLTKILLGE